MDRQERLADLISGKVRQACQKCHFFELDRQDPQGVGGTCKKSGEFCFCFEYCGDFEQAGQNRQVISDYKCPICGEKITQFKSQFATGSVGCQNDCFEKQEMIYIECPVCKKGKMSRETYHGTMYVKCDNKQCGFEISPLALITWVIKNK